MADQDAELQKAIQKSRLFKYLGTSEIANVLAGADLQQCREGAFFFMEKDPALHSFVLVQGKVRLSQLTLDGQQVILGYISPGREFGIIAALDDQTYPVSSQAAVDSLALVWDRQTLNNLMEAYPQISRNAMAIMARQIREFQNRIRELSTQRVERRIARALLRLAQQSGKRIPEGVLVDLPLTRQDLAELSGTTLYTVSRTMSQWEAQGLVISHREQVIICQSHKLVALAEDLPTVPDKHRDE